LKAAPPNLVFEPGRLRVLDQRRLPHEVEYVECTTWSQVAGCIHGLAVRGAPAIGIAAAYGLALAPDEEVEEAAKGLVAARPTAVNLAAAVARVRRAADRAAEARALHAEDAASCAAIAAAGAGVLPRGGRFLTHCNTGPLATGGCGTALGAVAAARTSLLFCCEARPVLQGARLTMWECAQLGLPAMLIVDGAAGHFLARGRIDAVVVGADRIARNGDVANKVGTYALAVLARRHGVPFYVAAPLSTFDPATPTGEAIPIEERGAGEVLGTWAPEGARAANPAFDVTPAELVEAYLTDRGVMRGTDLARPEVDPR
jgi:methylthioribose-1-phosphate isomerase